MDTFAFQSSRATPSHEGGFTLLEILVALLVLSLGLLGLAALQTIGVKFNQESYERTQATLLAYDIIDRIRANPTARTAGTNNFDNINITYSPNYPADATCTSSCTPANLRDFDIRRWKENIAATLPKGQGAICRGTLNAALTSCTVSASSTVYRVGLKWLEDDVPKIFIVEAQL